MELEKYKIFLEQNNIIFSQNLFKTLKMIYQNKLN